MARTKEEFRGAHHSGIAKGVGQHHLDSSQRVGQPSHRPLRFLVQPQHFLYRPGHADRARHGARLRWWMAASTKCIGIYCQRYSQISPLKSDIREWGRSAMLTMEEDF